MAYWSYIILHEYLMLLLFLFYFVFVLFLQLHILCRVVDANSVGLVNVGGEGGNFHGVKLEGRPPPSGPVPQPQPPRAIVEPSRSAWAQQAQPAPQHAQHNMHSE